MSSGIPQGLQKQMFIISSIGFAFTDFVQIISTIIYFIWGTRYDGFVLALILLVFLSLQVVISIVFIIISFTCWKGQFFEKIFKTYLNRFFYFSDLIVTHIPIISISMMFITLPDYEHKLGILKYIIFSISIIQSIFFITIIIGLIMICKIQSDKETIENSDTEDINQSFFRDPQKKMMQISLGFLFTFTIIDFILSVILYCKNSTQLFSVEMINSLFGGFSNVFLIVMLIVSQTCWKGTFVIKLVETKIRRLVGFLILFLYYVGYIAFELLYFFLNFSHSNKDKLFIFELSLSIVCPLIQLISLIVFTVGFCLAHRSKVKYDLHSSSLINNNDNVDNIDK